MDIEQQSILFEKMDEKEIKKLFELRVVNYQTMSRQFQDSYTFTPDSSYCHMMQEDT